MSYSNGYSETIRLPAAALASAGVKGRLIGPKGMQGRLVDIRAIVTTANDAAQAVSLGVSGDATKFGTLTVPSGSTANTGVNGMTRGASNIVDADTVLEVSSGGGGSVGAADILVTIVWY